MASKQRAVARSPNALSDAWEQRTKLVKQEQAATNAATEAKTARLRALRLEKEERDAADKAAIKPSVKARSRKAG